VAVGDLSLPRPRRRLLASRRRQVVAVAVVGAAFGFLAYQGLSNATEYFYTADQAVAKQASLGTQPFRIEGTVEPGVTHTGAGTTFDIVANDVSVHVVDSAQPPELFKVGIPVVLEGHWQGAYYAADQIMVKHTASYVEAHPSRLKSQLPSSSSATAAARS
jgi:cytochrome c-type biogenesis protein CcmE